MADNCPYSNATAISPAAAESLDASRPYWRLGIAIVAVIPMSSRMIRISMSVKPF